MTSHKKGRMTRYQTRVNKALQFTDTIQFDSIFDILYCGMRFLTISFRGILVLEDFFLRYCGFGYASMSPSFKSFTKDRKLFSLRNIVHRRQTLVKAFLTDGFIGLSASVVIDQNI